MRELVSKIHLNDAFKIRKMSALTEGAKGSYLHLLLIKKVKSSEWKKLAIN